MPGRGELYYHWRVEGSRIINYFCIKPRTRFKNRTLLVELFIPHCFRDMSAAALAGGRGSKGLRGERRFFTRRRRGKITKYNREMYVFLFGNADFNPDCEVHGHCYGSIGGNKWDFRDWTGARFAVTSERGFFHYIWTYCFNLNANHKTVLVIFSCALIPFYQLFATVSVDATKIRFRLGDWFLQIRLSGLCPRPNIEYSTKRLMWDLGLLAGSCSADICIHVMNFVAIHNEPENS